MGGAARPAFSVAAQLGQPGRVHVDPDGRLRDLPPRPAQLVRRGLARPPERNPGPAVRPRGRCRRKRDGRHGNGRGSDRARRGSAGAEIPGPVAGGVPGPVAGGVTGAPAEGAAVPAVAGRADQPAWIAASTSCRVIRPSGPEPGTAARSSPAFRASCLISGDATGTRRGAAGDAACGSRGRGRARSGSRGRRRGRSRSRGRGRAAAGAGGAAVAGAGAAAGAQPCR